MKSTARSSASALTLGACRHGRARKDRPQLSDGKLARQSNGIVAGVDPRLGTVKDNSTRSRRTKRVRWLAADFKHLPSSQSPNAVH